MGLPLSVVGYSEQDTVEGRVLSIEGQASTSLEDGYEDADERGRLAQVRAAHPHLGIPVLRLVAAAVGGEVNELASSSPP